MIDMYIYELSLRYTADSCLSYKEKVVGKKTMLGIMELVKLSF